MVSPCQRRIPGGVYEYAYPIRFRFPWPVAISPRVSLWKRHISYYCILLYLVPIVVRKQRAVYSLDTHHPSPNQNQVSTISRIPHIAVASGYSGYCIVSPNLLYAIPPVEDTAFWLVAWNNVTAEMNYFTVFVENFVEKSKVVRRRSPAATGWHGWCYERK